mmetsp:Transcript_23406/g.37457  ORF Transcript_23406/g.37457 Transcript_23406/m.37457 type:complete len:369 (+) Transcript_23406:16-1122(+)|eukprot:CAMPEP_0202687792 /NCGR_PEP_ID=MMETSP1385-20130828/3405_1 /ASSEMBLY_ACC=CAM_ASM_000861 /TAXON_ID=933848 /ORGANISM="Elphidium margaritaceum" /LENGTH=368 /DNA_ID=CAMNT_0049342639 /DNA_START=10 /DNA_END=1116 /DNA_ORIENTATION=-
MALELLNDKLSFVAPYKWDGPKICMIRHQHGGFLRANPKNHQECNYKGGQTDWSKWQIFLHENAKIIQIQNVKTKKYLDIDKHGQYISVASEGGTCSKFILHRFALHNNNNNNVSAAAATGNVSTSTSTSSSSDTTSEVVMNGGGGGGGGAAAVHANDGNNDEQQSSESKQSESVSPVLGLNNVHSEYGVVLESQRTRGLYVSVHPNDGVYISKDRQHTHNRLYFLVRGKRDDGVFRKPYLLKAQNTIIISHAFGGTVRINPKNENIVDHQGDKDILSQWEALPDSNASVLQFKNVKSGAFLRIKEKTVSCCERKSDPNTKFLVHVVQSNIVKLESAVFEGQFISVRQKGLCIGNGGPHCQMTLYQKE